MIFHWGGPRHGQVAQIPDRELTTGVLVYGGPEWFGVYQRIDPPSLKDTDHGPADVWVVME